MRKSSRTGKVAHDLGLSTWFGGTLFGQVDLNPAVSGVRDDSELRAPGLRRAKDVLLGGAAFSTVASAILGASTAAVSRGGATPVRSGTKPSRRTPPEAALGVGLLRLTGNGSLALLAAAVVVSALIEASEPKPRGILSRLLSG